VIPPASEPIIRAIRPKNQAADVGQKDSANSTPKSNAPHTPMASTRFWIPSDMMAPPVLTVISPARNIPSSRKTGARTRCMYFCKKSETAGIDIAVMARNTASAR